MPEGIVDRPADVWEPLVILGDVAGEPWSGRIRTAAVALNTERARRDPSLGVQLLSDIRTALAGRDRISSEELVETLVGMESAPWGDLRGKPIDARGIARRLRKYEVRSGDHRFGDTIRKGYLAEDLYDAFERYLPVALVADVAHPDPERGDAERSPVASPEDGVGGEVPYNGETATEGGLFALPFPPAANGQQGQHAQLDGICPGCGGPPGSFSPLCPACCTLAAEADAQHF
jgi:hypothetical protein